MKPESKEHSNTDQGRDGGQTSVAGFIGRFAVAHTVAYFIAGMIFG